MLQFIAISGIIFLTTLIVSQLVKPLFKR